MIRFFWDLNKLSLIRVLWTGIVGIMVVNIMVSLNIKHYVAIIIEFIVILIIEFIVILKMMIQMGVSIEDKKNNRIERRIKCKNKEIGKK